MISYIPKYKTLVVLAEKDSHDLVFELGRFPCTKIDIHGTPENLEALGDHPLIEEVSLRKNKQPDLGFLRGMKHLRRLHVAFGSLSKLDLDFCSETLEVLGLGRLKQLKDLSTLPRMPRLVDLGINYIHGFQPPDFRSFPNLSVLSICNTEWPSLDWLRHLQQLERLHISDVKVEDGDWKPILGLSQLRELQGLKYVFGATAGKEFSRLKPDIRADEGFTPDKKRYAKELEQADDFLNNRFKTLRYKGVNLQVTHPDEAADFAHLA